MKFSKKNKKLNNRTLKKEREKTLKTFTQLSKTKITARDDFYTYINDAWLTKQNHLKILKKKFYTQYDDVRIKQEEVYYEIMGMIENHIKRENTKESRQLEKLYKSAFKRHDKESEWHIRNSTKIVHAFVEDDDLYGLLAYINKNEMVKIASPITWNVMPDLKNPSIMRNYLNIPTLPYYDYDLYILDKPGDSKEKRAFKHEFNKEYVKYGNAVFKEIYGRTDEKIGYDLVSIGVKILKCIQNEKIKSSEGYNIVYAKDCLKLYGFDWYKFAKLLGYKTAPEFFICDDVNYFKSVMEELNKNWKSNEWISWWEYIIIKQQLRFNEKHYHVYFEFYRKYVQGAELRVPKDINPIFTLSLAFNKLISGEYIRKNYSQKKIDYVKNMGEELRGIFIDILNRNTWLSPKAKKIALLKLKNIKFVIGIPCDTKNLIEDPQLDYSPTDIWGNLEKIYGWRCEQFIKMSDGPSNKNTLPYTNWTAMSLSGRQPYVVNAFYTPLKNDVYITLAYLQKPFLDLDERGIEYNLAYIGFTIGHELAHSLDNTGRKFDHTGKMVNWFEPRDVKIYQQKMENIKKHYTAFVKLDGHILDIENTMGENCADITSAIICEEYLYNFQKKNENIALVKYLSFQAFYAYIAVQMKQTILKQSMHAQLNINPHPPDKYRVNVPLSNLYFFKYIYSIKPGDNMYWEDLSSSIW